MRMRSAQIVWLTIYKNQTAEQKKKTKVIKKKLESTKNYIIIIHNYAVNSKVKNYIHKQEVR